MNKLLILLIGVCLTSLVSANGLNLVNSTFQINKTNGIDEKFSITLLNQGTFTFYNITSQNDLLEFPKFNLESGQNKTIEVTIKKNQDYSGEIKIIGEYFTNLGTSNETYNIDITNDGLSLCNLDLIKGDTLNWHNTLLSQVKLKNLNTDEYFATLEPQQNYSQFLETSQEFDYQVFRIGLPYSAICHINIRPTECYSHSTEFDATLNLQLNLNYEPTEVSTTFLITSYNLSYDGIAEDLFSIRNDGVKVAKNIHLSGDWITFDENDFDLNSGASKVIGYTIKPIIFNSNQTGQTYNLTIQITGNFETITQIIQVYINPHDFISGTNGLPIDVDTLQNLLNLFCLQYPDRCPVKIVSSNTTDGNTAFTIGTETFRDYIESQVNKQESDNQNFKDLKESIFQIRNETLSKEDIERIESGTNKNSADIENLSNIVIVYGIILMLIALGVILVLGFKKYAPLILLHKKSNFEKGEKEI